MANKIDAVIDAIEASLGELVAAGKLKGVKRGVINPLTEPQQPVIAVAPSRFRRNDDTWICEVLLMLCCRAGSGDADASVTDALIEVDAKIEALADAGTAGAAIDSPVWDSWHVPDRNALSCVGAIGSLRYRLECPLLT